VLFAKSTSFPTNKRGGETDERLFEFIVVVGTVIYAILGEQLYLLVHKRRILVGDVVKLGVFLDPFIKLLLEPLPLIDALRFFGIVE
jgi:hypothetical protein